MRRNCNFTHVSLLLFRIFYTHCSVVFSCKGARRARLRLRRWPPTCNAELCSALQIDRQLSLSFVNRAAAFDKTTRHIAGPPKAAVR
jgi:hypothetical protein